MISIYGLIDPRTQELRYIGKSTNVKNRVATHYREARNGNQLHSRRWLHGLIKCGAKADVEILEITETNDEANEAERFWISSMRLAGCNLTNRTPGGDGQPKGWKRSQEAVEKSAAASRGKRRTTEQKEIYRKAFNTPEVREKRRSAVETLKATNPKWLEKVRYGRTGIPVSEKTKQKISAAWTPERRTAHAEQQRAKPVDERWKKQLAAALRARWDRKKAA